MEDTNEESRILADTLEKYYEDILKVALAISIIRTKPQHMSGRVYAQILNTNLTGSEKHWKSKVEALEQELLLVKEELIKTKVSLPAATRSEEELTSLQIEGAQKDEQNTDTLECLTPPCSSESLNSCEPTLSSNMENSHVKFLKSIATVWSAPGAAAMLKETQFCFNLITTVIQSVNVLQERIHDSCFAETSIPEYCVDSLIGLIDIESQDSGRTVEIVLGFSNEMILAIMNHEICSNHTILDKYSKLIIRLASHKKITKVVLCKLTEQLVAFSNILRAISQEPMKMQENLKKYNSIYYILWCIEKVLLKTTENNTLQSVSKSLMETLEDSVLHLSKTFPLFTCYVWRIGGLISTVAAEEKMEVEPS